jgi:hypothetical protein
MARRSNLKKLPRKRRIHDRSLPPAPANATVVSAVVQGTTTKVKFTFNSAIMPGGPVPQYSANSVLPTTVDSWGTNFVILNYAAAKAAAEPFSVPTLDPGARTIGGGYAAATVGALA